MRPLPPVIFAGTKEKLLQQIDDVHMAICDFFSDIPGDLLLAPAEPQGWTVLKNMKHIVSTNHMMSFWIALPPGLLRILGRPVEPQPTVEELVPTNRPHIRDHGLYRAHHACDPSRKELLLARIKASAGTLKKAVDRHSEEELDRLKGAFGGMSLRTFVHFILKHNLYHTGVVRARLNH